MVFWASSLYAANDTAHTGSSYHRILRATTTDFITFSTPQVYIDYGWSVIDTTITYDSSTSTYYRFNKDERTNSASAPNGKFVFEEKSSNILGTWSSIVAGIGKGTISRGEGPTVFKSNTVANKVRYGILLSRNKNLTLQFSGICLLMSLAVSWLFCNWIWRIC